MRINHNIAALNTYRQLNSASTAQGKSMEKLSSGLRINKAGDDAAGLAISEKMRSQVRGLDMASKNAQDANSMIQTAEGALNETHDILQRMRELTVQASNDTNTTDDRGEIQKEINQLTSEINRIGNTTEFNTKKLLNGDLSSTKTTVTPGSKTTVDDIASKDMNYAVGVTWTLADPSKQPTLIGTSNNQVTIAADDGGVFDYGTATAGKLTIQKDASGELKVNLTGGVEGTDTLDFTDENAILKDGFYEYDNHGISFKVSEADVKAMSAGDKVEVDFGARDTATLSNTGDISLSSDYSAATIVSNKNVIADFEVDGDKLNSNAASIEISMAAGDKLTVTVKDANDQVLNTATTSALAASEGFDSYGIKFSLNSDFASGDTFTLKPIKLTATTTDTSTTKVEDASATFQIGANENQSMSLSFSDMRAKALGLVGNSNGFSSEANVTNGTNNTNVENALDVTSATTAAKAITVIDKAIKDVSAERSKLGASQNRLDHTINNLGTASENLTAAESRIRDVDMAKEMMNQTKNSILSQAAQAMLAQANQQPQGVLQLLR